MVVTKNRNNSKSEFAINEELDLETTGGIFMSYRTLAFAFVTILAITVAGAFIYVSTNPSDEEHVSFDILNFLISLKLWGIFESL